LVCAQLRQQSEYGKRHQEPIWRVAAAQAEGNTQGVALKLWESFQMVESRGAKLLERRECQLEFPLSPRSPQNPKVRCRRDSLLDEGRLADARLSKHNERFAPAIPSRRQQPVKYSELALPTEQHL
jgi:hypothetical protein